jgi:hypothetical protein
MDQIRDERNPVILVRSKYYISIEIGFIRAADEIKKNYNKSVKSMWQFWDHI